MIEVGQNWMNAKFRALYVPSQFYLLVLIRAAVDGGRLPSFAPTAASASVFKRVNVTTLSQPTFGLNEVGYNTGNYLLCKSFFRLLLF